MSLPQLLPEITQEHLQTTSLAQAVQTLQAATDMLRQSMLMVNAMPARVDQQFADLKAQFHEEVTDPLLKRMSAIEAKQRDAILVTPMDKQTIKEAVAAKVRQVCPDGVGREKHFARLYGRLHREFGISGYEYLRRVDLAQALKYIASYDGQRTTWEVKDR